MRKIKRITSMLVVLAMVMTFIPNVIVSAETTFTGNGTEESPYIISSAEDMKALSTAVNGGESYKGKYFKVSDEVSKIELTTEGGFEPIGTEYEISFAGTFDGNNKEFALNLSMPEAENVGLFGYSKGVIKNVITSGTVTGYKMVGGIAGHMVQGLGKTINCHNKADINGDRYVGGICGDNYHSIINCSNSGTINATNYVGGIAGYVTDGSGAVINCINTGSVKGNIGTGGIVGYFVMGELANCINNGPAAKKDDSGAPVGGIAGIKGSSTIIKNCYYNADINEGVYDIGHNSPNDNTPVQEEVCKKTASELLSESTLEALNFYASRNKPDGYSLLYWKVNDNVISFTEEVPSLPPAIINNASLCITVDEYAHTGDTVTITKKAQDYLNIISFTVKKADGSDVSLTESDGVYTFSMPDSDVTIDAVIDIKLSKDGDVYKITSADDMKILSNAVNNGFDTTGKTFKVSDEVSKIELTTEGGFEPIGTEYEISFAGTFDGNNKEFELNLLMPKADYVGLFGYSKGVIKNVITSGAVTGDDNVGGIVGRSSSYMSKIINCHNNAVITGNSYYVGGICGSSSGSVINCSNSAPVSSRYYVGGIAGESSSSGKIVNCINTGSVKGNRRTGGIVGNSWSVTISNCVNNGPVAKKDDSGAPVGGIAGLNSDGVTIENSYYNADINEGVYDIGHNNDDDDTPAQEEVCKKTEAELLSESTLEALNLYSVKNKVDEYSLLYWKVNDKVISLTDEKQSVPFVITNNASACVTAAEGAKSGSTVTITPKTDGYLKLISLTVKSADGSDVSFTESNGVYTFTMPESDVTIDAVTDIKLSKDGDVYKITSAADMKILSNAVNNGFDTTGKTFKVSDEVSKIELTTEDGFVPIGTSEKTFGGTFDGNNKEFALNLSMPEVSRVGLFGCSKGVIKNVITSGTVTGYEIVGGIAGILYSGDGKIINCHNKAVITGSNYVGGICGDNSSKIINCSNSASVSSNADVGGIVGRTDGLGKVVNCINTGSVKGNSKTGGIVGNSWAVTISNCVNNGPVAKKDDSGAPVGGIAGLNADYLTIENSYYNADINEGVYDIGHNNDNDNTPVQEEVCKKTEAELLSESTLDSLNLYARKNKVDGYSLLYWKVNDKVIALTEEVPSFPFEITNNASNYITVANGAKSGSTVTFTVKESSYEKINKVEVVDVDGEFINVTTSEDGKTYSFVMPAKNVSIDVSAELMLDKEEDDDYVYLISSLDELIIFANAVNSGKYADASAKLTADIAVSTEKGFVPIGTEEYPYAGCFYGEGHTLTLDIKSGTDYNGTTATGLFGVAEDAVIYELILKGSVDGGADTNSYTGALIGAVGTENTYVCNVYSEVSVSGSGYVGGMTGYGNDDYIAYRNVIVNGTVTQKDVSENKKAVGMFTGMGDYWGTNAYYNSDKSGGAFDRGYDENGDIVETARWNKTTEELFSDETLAVLTAYSKTSYYLYFDFVKENDVFTVKFVKDAPIVIYMINAEDMLFDMGINYNETDNYALPGKKATITLNSLREINQNIGYYFGFDIIKSIKGIEVVDSKGNIIETEKTGTNEYEFVMPESNVRVTVLYEFNIEVDDNGVYNIAGVEDLIVFAMIVASGDTKANAKVIAKEISINNLNWYNSYYSTSEGIIREYEGVFDGNGAKIQWSGPIFGDTHNAVIKNLNVDNRYGDYSGLVYGAENTLIDNCNVSIYDGGYDGGVVIYAYGSTITNCSVTAEDVDSSEFGGIAFETGDGTVIANCILTADTDVNDIYSYGGIVYSVEGKTEIYNCANEDVSFIRNYINDAGAIVCGTRTSELVLDNNFYIEDDDWSSIKYRSYIGGIADNSYAVDYNEYSSAYIPVMLNEYVRDEANKIDGVTFNKWSYDTYNYKTVFANNNYPEIYSLKQDGAEVKTYTDDVNSDNSYGAFGGGKVYIWDIPKGAVVSVTDENNNAIQLKEESGEYVFKMPECNVTISAVMDTGIEETKEIDGKKYVVVKTADDFIKAVTSIANGNTALNIYIGNDIELTAENTADYPIFAVSENAVNSDDLEYNGIFEGAGHTITFESLTNNTSSTEEAKIAMFDIIGEKGIVKNVTIGGTIGCDGYAASIAHENKGIILNCSNAADVNGEAASGIVRYNNGVIENCINNGNITATERATAVAYYNYGGAYNTFNQGTVTGELSNVMVEYDYGNTYNLIDLTSPESDIEIKDCAAGTNGEYEQMRAMVELGFVITNDELYTLANAAEWSVDESGKLVFADEENAPYYHFLGFGGQEIHKAGETVTLTLDPTIIEEGFELSDVVIRKMFADEEINAEIVTDMENTYSFTMPAGVCKAEIIKEAEGLTRDDDGYYLVGTLDELMKVKSTIGIGNNAINIRLTDDIEGYTGTPIGGDYGYDGIFDGGNHSITVNMEAEEGSRQQYGLFKTLGENSVVKNLTIKGSISANSYKLGAIAGESRGAIIDCTNYATVENKYSDYAYTGGIVGYMQNGIDNYFVPISLAEDEKPIFAGLIRGCENYGNVSADGENGGIVGKCENGISSANTVTIEDCVNNAEINGEYVGGIVSYCVGTKNNYISISNCINNGALNGEEDVGGIVSEAKYANIDGCINNADVTASDEAGGIIACSEYDVNISNCVNNGTVYAEDWRAGGIAGSADEIEIINCINNGDITSDGDYACGILGKCYYDMVIKNCYNSGNVVCDENAYAIALHDDYPYVDLYDAETEKETEEEESTFIINNCFYIQNETVNTDIASSNVYANEDNSEAVTQEDITSGYVLGKLNSKVMSGMKKWTEKDGAVVFADSDDEDIKYYYEIIINKNINGGTVTADKVCAKAGETVKLTITPEVEGKTAVVTGVKLDENNSFVMPDNTVRIDVKFGDGFAATEKSDVIELAENVKADDIVLADYVKFVNDDVTRDFGFALAEGTVLPDGMRLSYGRIVGTPSKAGTYTVVIDVTDPSGVELMSLDKDVALGNAQLTLTLEVAKTYKISISEAENGKVTADKEYAKAGESVKLTAKANGGYMLEKITGVKVDENNTFIMPENDVTIGAVFAKDENAKPVISGEDDSNGKHIVKYFVPEGVEYYLISVEYTDGALTKINVISSDEDTNNGELVVEKGKNTKIMIWNSLLNMKPLCDSYTVK